MTKPCILAVVGCTASGKSDLALRLSKSLMGEIVCMDSMQVYRRMDIGTAKPTKAEQAEAPHHMLDILEPTEPFAVADYVSRVESLFPEILDRGHVPVLVGGTGLYLKSLMHGMTLGASAGDPAFRARCEAVALEPEGKQKLHDMLEKADPDTAGRLHPNDLRRVIRALEVFELTGMPMSSQKRQEPERPFRIFPMGIRMPRASLYERIEQRVDRMLELGLLSEVAGLLESGVSPECQSMQAIGYKELIPVARGHMALSAAKEQLALNTKHYAKRQETWFKAEAAMRWLEAGEGAVDAALSLWNEFLNTDETRNEA